MFHPTDLQDRIRHAQHLEDVREPTFRTVARMEGIDPAVQVRALALAMIVVADEVGIPVFDLISQARRSLPYAEDDYHYNVQALREYVRRELVRRPLA